VVVIIAAIRSKKRLTLLTEKVDPVKWRLLVLLFDVARTVYYISERDVFSYIRDLHGHFLTERGVTHNDDKSTLNASNTVALVADTFNFYSPPFSLFDRRARLGRTAVRI